MQECGKLKFTFIFKRYLRATVCFRWQALAQSTFFSEMKLMDFERHPVAVSFSLAFASFVCDICCGKCTFTNSSNSNPFTFTFIVIACKIDLKYISFLRWFCCFNLKAKERKKQFNRDIAKRVSGFLNEYIITF